MNRRYAPIRPISAFAPAGGRLILCYNHAMDTSQPAPLILGFIADLMFSVKVENVAERLGYRVRWVESAGEFGPPTPEASWRQPAEHMEGRGAVLLARIAEWQPALILFDLGHPEVPWQRWLPLIKSAPATRRIPVVCFGSHVDVETLELAKRSGADAVLARSRFTSDLPNVIQKYARVPDFAGMQAACEQPLSDLALKGLEEFNRGDYFEAHEWLEHAWNADDSAVKELYRAILQVAVAYLQIERGNYNGAAKMFMRLRQWIEPLPDRCRGVDVARLRQDAERVRIELLRLGPARLDEFDRRLFQPVRYDMGDLAGE